MKQNCVYGLKSLRENPPKPQHALTPGGVRRGARDEQPSWRSISSMLIALLLLITAATRYGTADWPEHVLHSLGNLHPHG